MPIGSYGWELYVETPATPEAHEQAKNHVLQQAHEVRFLHDDTKQLMSTRLPLQCCTKQEIRTSTAPTAHDPIRNLAVLGSDPPAPSLYNPKPDSNPNPIHSLAVLGSNPLASSLYMLCPSKQTQLGVASPNERPFPCGRKRYGYY